MAGACVKLASMDEPVAVRTTFAGSWGPVFVAATERGIAALEWLTTEEAFDAAVARRLGGRVASAGSGTTHGNHEKHLESTVQWLEAFLAGRPVRDKDRPPIDLTDRNPWDRRVLEAVLTIPWGQTASYGQIARQVGSPRASRAVGGALGRNPIMFLIPCHRVIASDGTLGGWGGERWGDTDHRLRDKRDLLLREGITVAPREG